MFLFYSCFVFLRDTSDYEVACLLTSLTFLVFCQCLKALINIVDPQFDRKLALAPGFVVPSNLDYEGYHSFIDEMLPHESPVHYGLHPNAEIEFLTVTSDRLFHTLLELQTRDSSMGEGAPQSTEEKV